MSITSTLLKLGRSFLICLGEIYFLCHIFIQLTFLLQLTPPSTPEFKKLCLGTQVKEEVFRFCYQLKWFVIDPERTFLIDTEIT
jgi:hypothetical protein